MMKRRIAILGGGPSALFIYKELLAQGMKDCDVDVFEASDRIGCGMPYGKQGALREHFTNVSSNETPSLPQSLAEWIEDLPHSKLEPFGINREDFNERKTIPRLLFGNYLSHQFEVLMGQAQKVGVRTNLHLSCRVVDVLNEVKTNEMTVILETGVKKTCDVVIVCTGHVWPKTNEGKVEGYFDSPYPLSKLVGPFDHEVAIRGSSLTSIDAIMTLARQHGSFSHAVPHMPSYKKHDDFKDFKITMHSTHGLLPAVRFHIDDPELEEKLLFSEHEIARIREAHDGFVPIDLIFERKFKDIFREKDPKFYSYIKDRTIETFVKDIMDQRQRQDAFDLLRSEYDEARRSIAKERSIYWKEVVGALSFIINYPAKHFSAEDLLRLRDVLLPLISVIIAYVPQRSCEELMALQEAGCLSLLAVGEKSNVECENDSIVYNYSDKEGRHVSKHYSTFVDCIGQRRLPKESFPFKSLLDAQILGRAFVNFKSNAAAEQLAGKSDDVVETEDGFRLYLSGFAVNDSFQAVNDDQIPSDRLYILAVPFIGGHNPDYSGLDFCSEAAKRVVAKIAETFAHKN